MRAINHEFNAQILAGVKDADLETAADTLHKVKKNLVRYLNGSQEQDPDDKRDSE
jgi:hypothetical protein